MKKVIITLLIVFLSFCSLDVKAEQEFKQYNRIISFSPSVTETLYALGLGEKVVAVTRYCLYPPEAQEKPTIGGLLDVNFEQVYRLKPDLLISSAINLDQRKTFEKMGIKTLEVGTKSVKSVLESIRIIGTTLGKEKKALEIVNEIKNHINKIRSSVKDLDRPRVLVTFLRPVGEGNIREAYIAGNDSYFNDLLDITGGQNVYQGTALITSPLVTTEGIIQMNPDVVVEIMNVLKKTNLSTKDVIRDWDILSSIPAVKNKRIYVLDESYIGIPGPRIVKALDDLLEAIHPEIDIKK